MRSLQLALHSGWDFVDDLVVVEWSPSNQEDLLWWSDPSNLQGVSLDEVRPDLLFWSDASDQGRGAHLRDQFVSGIWSQAERSLSINLQELRAVRLGLHHFRHLSRGLCRQHHHSLLRQETGGTFSLALNTEAQLLLRWAEEWRITLVPPIHYGVPECGCQLVKSSSSGPGVGMDPLPGCCRLPPGSVAGNGVPLRHCHELLPAGLFLTTRRSYVSGHRCLSSDV